MPVAAERGGDTTLPKPKPKPRPEQTLPSAPGMGGAVYERGVKVPKDQPSPALAPHTPSSVAPQSPQVKWVQPPGLGPNPWDGTGVQVPHLNIDPSQPKTTSSINPKIVQAGRGVIGTIRQQAALYHVPPALALAVAKEESGYNQEAVSSAGAIGVMQLMPDTARGLGVDPNNWKQNIHGGVRLLGELIHQYHGDVNAALQAYNGGPGNVGSSETQHYAQTVLGIAGQISGGHYKPSGGSTGVVMISAPLPGNPTVTSGFGPRSDPFGGGGDFHDGVDLSAPQGTPIHAMIGGQVTFSGWGDGSGNTVTIKDKTGRLWNYFHMVQAPPVRVGQKVQAGQQIGNVGSTGESTGPHLDIHLMVNGSWVNPMAVIRKAYKAGWDKTAKTTLSYTDFLAADQGGVNGSGQPAGGPSGSSSGGAGGGMVPGGNIVGMAAQPAQSVDAAVIPGGSAAMPANYAAWQRILSSGPVSPETKNLAARAGVVDQSQQNLSEVYQNPGGGA